MLHIINQFIQTDRLVFDNYVNYTFKTFKCFNRKVRVKVVNRRKQEKVTES